MARLRLAGDRAAAKPAESTLMLSGRDAWAVECIVMGCSSRFMPRAFRLSAPRSTGAHPVPLPVRLLCEGAGRRLVVVDVVIERDAELAVLEEAVAAAGAGHGRAALVEGEAGIGKTRLLEAARVHAIASRARALYATADEIEADVPLAAARALLARAAGGFAPGGPSRLGVLALAGGLGETGAPGSRGDQVVHALWWLIVELAEEGPLALFLDDAQWADELTLALLRLAARRARELPLTLVVAARPAGADQRH